MTTQNKSNPQPEAQPEEAKPEFKTLAVQVSKDVHRSLRILAAETDTTVKAIVEAAMARFIDESSKAASAK
jgi:hypothetical protein